MSSDQHQFLKWFKRLTSYIKETNELIDVLNCNISYNIMFKKNQDIKFVLESTSEIKNKYDNITNINNAICKKSHY